MKVDLSQLLANYTGEAKKKVDKYAEEEKTWYYIEVILTLFTISFFVIFAIRPAVVTISGLVGEVQRKKELSQRMKQKINEVIIAQEEYSLVQKNWEVLASFLPSEFDLPQGIAQLAGSAQEEDVSLTNLSLDDLDFVKHEVKSKKKEIEADNKNLEGLNFSFKTKNDLEALKNFISQIKQSRRWTQVGNYQLSKADRKEKEEETGSIDLLVDGFWLFWLEKNETKKDN